MRKRGGENSSHDFPLSFFFNGFIDIEGNMQTACNEFKLQNV